MLLKSLSPEIISRLLTSFLPVNNRVSVYIYIYRALLPRLFMFHEHVRVQACCNKFPRAGHSNGGLTVYHQNCQMIWGRLHAILENAWQNYNSRPAGWMEGRGKKTTTSMIAENRQLVTNEPVEFEKEPVEFQDCMKITGHLRGIYRRIYPQFNKGNRRMSTCNWLDLQTLGSHVIMPKNLSDH